MLITVIVDLLIHRCAEHVQAFMYIRNDPRVTVPHSCTVSVQQLLQPDINAKKLI